MEFEFISSIAATNTSDINECLSFSKASFCSYDYLYAIEKSNVATMNEGWEVNHLCLKKNKKLEGFIPIYKKNNSNGEFVFDHQWAHAHHQANRSYYPKLLSASPYTPCEGQKFFTKEDQSQSEQMINVIKDYMEEKNFGSWHILFPDSESRKILKKFELIERSGYRFVWKNRNYKDFDSFMGILKSRQRKNIKKEREGISDYGIKFVLKDNKNLTIDDWSIFYEFYCKTYIERYQKPYFNIDFFRNIHRKRLSLNPLIIFAQKDNESVAAALFFVKNNKLYGRHWGSNIKIKDLHFELCYYQGIEYCIRHKLKIFDPGIQGEYKMRRGFEAIETYSYHLFLENDVNDVILKFCKKEKDSIKAYLNACKDFTPIKSEYKI